MNGLSSRCAGHWTSTVAFLLFVPVLTGQTSNAPVREPNRNGSSREAINPAKGPDLRVVQALEKGDREGVRTLLKQHADINGAEGDGATALSWAVYLDDLEMANLLIAAGANVNAANDYGVTPLSLACANVNATLVDRLLKAGGNPNAARLTGETVLMTCAKTGNADAVKALLAQGANVNSAENQNGQTPLMWALAGKHPEVVRLLIEHGANVHARTKGGFTTLMFAAEQGDVDSAAFLLTAGAKINVTTPENGSALMVAAFNGHEPVAKFLIDKGADPNITDRNGVTALHYTVLRGLSMSVGVQLQPFNYHMFRPNLLETAKALLAHGANPNARITTAPVGLKHAHNTGQRSGLADGATAFLIAAFTSDVDMMRALMAGGADPSIATKGGVTPLMVAAGLGRGRGGYEAWRWRQTGHPEVTDQTTAARALETVKFLLDNGADVNATNKFDETALHSAAHDGSDAIVKLLVEKGAKIDAKDMYGQTALSIAEAIVPNGSLNIVLITRLPHKSTAELLLKLGANPELAAAVKQVNIVADPKAQAEE
jgi:ankyrin repeat protein